MIPMYIVSRNQNLYVVAKTNADIITLHCCLTANVLLLGYMSKSFIRKNFENYIETCDNLQIYLYKEGVTF